jgi:hypothetical protein
MGNYSDLRREKLLASFDAGGSMHTPRGGLRKVGLLALLVLGGALSAVAAPVNDNFASATVITGVSGATSGSTVGATKEPGEPNHAGNAGGASVWFNWVAPANGTVTFNTEGSSFDTLLGVYIGASVSTLGLVASNDDVLYPDTTSAVTFVAVSGTEYRIAVDGYSGASGNYTLTWLYPVVNETVLSTAVTNVSNFIYDSDALIGGAYNRDKLLITSTVVSANTSSAKHYTTYVLSYRLLDTNNLPQPIFDSSGVTNTDYTCNVTNTVLIGAFNSVTSTTPAAVKPAAKLDPYNQYSVELRIFRLGIFTGATGSSGSAIYLEFTNLVSGDVALNTIPYQFIDSWVQTYAVKTAPGQTAFQASTFYGLYRYDDFNAASPTTNNVTVYLNYELHNATSGALIPLKNSTTNFVHAVSSYTAGTPKSVGFALVQDTLLLEPVSQLDSVSSAYYVVVKLSVDEGLGPPYLAGNALQSPTNQLLHFDGNLLFGSIPTYFTAIGNAPAPGALGGGGINTQLAVTNNSGTLTTNPAYHYGNGTALNVVLLSNGDALAAAGSTVSLTGSDIGCIQNICFTRSSVILSNNAIKGFIALHFPVGFSVGINPTNRLTVAGLEYPNTALDQNLNPLSNVFVTAGPLYGVHEELPFWIAAPSVTWQVNSGQIVLNPTGGVFARQFEDDVLTAFKPVLVESNAANRISNDGYYRNANVLLGSNVTIYADSNGAARVAANLVLNPPELRPHFPYAGSAPGRQLPTAPNGSLVIQDSLVASNSVLLLSNTVPMAYARDCDDTNCSASLAGPAVLQFSAAGNQLGFTPDGGLLAYGTVPSANLTWGYVSGGNYAQQAGPVQAGAYHMPGTFLRGDQTTLAPTLQPAVLLFTGFGDASNPSYFERPGQSNYVVGAANYGGLNFRLPASGRSFLAGQDTGTYPLTDSKYYVRAGGVSGKHQALTFPPGLMLYGYQFTFLYYRLSFLDSENWESRTDGAISFPTQPAGFTQEFQRMKFTCRGALDSAQVPPNSGLKHLNYWTVDFTPQSIEFHPQTSDTCGTGPRFLVLGVETHLPFIPQAFHAALGFKPNGNLVTVADAVAGTDSRFAVPAQLSLQGPGTSLFPLSTASEGYFNNWETAGKPANGFYNLVGKLRVPFFTDVKTHLHVTPTGTNTAHIDIMGGWPAPDSSAPDLGWSISGSNYFNAAKFDPHADGWPVAQTPNIGDYRNPTTTQYHPRAQRDWIEVAFFDYSLQWNPALREFAGFQDAQVILPVINVNSRLKELSPGKVDFDFAQDISLQLPRIKALDFLNDAANELNGPLDSVSNAVRSALSATLDTVGLNQLQQALREDAGNFFEPVLAPALDPVVDALYTQLAALPQNDLPTFLSNVVVIVNNPANHLQTAINNINGAAGQANTVIGQLDGTLTKVTDTIGLFSRVLDKDPGDGKRHAVRTIVQKLVSDQGPDLGFVADLADTAVDPLLTDLDPTLTEIQGDFTDVSNQIAQVHQQLTSVSGDFNQALGEALGDVNAMNQFVQSASTALSNHLAAVINSSGDYFTADPAAAKAAIRKQLVLAFLGSALPSNCQQTMRQFLFDDNYVVDQLMDVLFDQINGTIRDGLSSLITDAQDGIFQNMKGIGTMPQSFLSAKIRGSPTFNGDSLRKIHLGAAIQLNVPDPMNFNAYMEIKELDSQSAPVDCIPAGGPAAEVTLGAKDVKLDWASLNPSGTPLVLTVEARWTLQSGNVIGIGGLVDIKGKVGFQGCSINEIGATLAFGELENYFAAKAAGTITIVGIPVDVQAGVFVGHACSLDPLVFIDPDADQVLGGKAVEFSGIYVEFGGGVSLSEILFGSSSCLLDVEAKVTTATFYNGGPTKQQIGMRQKVEVDLALLCLLSGNASFTMFGALTHTASGFELDLSGNAQICGSIGPCPFCISGCAGIGVTGVVNSGGIDYHIDY